MTKDKRTGGHVACFLSNRPCMFFIHPGFLTYFCSRLLMAFISLHAFQVLLKRSMIRSKNKRKTLLALKLELRSRFLFEEYEVICYLGGVSVRILSAET